MNCRVLHILSPRPGGSSPIMPVDMAMRICLASSPPLRSFLSNYDNRCSSSAAALLKHCEPLRPCLSSFSSNIATATTTSASTELGGGAPGWLRRKKKKKSVVFADSRGLALTAIHVFDETEDPLAELQFHLTEIEVATVGLHLGDSEEAPDWGPGLVLDFIQPGSDYLDLRNRLKAQQDVPCLFLNNIYGRPDTDTFSFSILVPEVLGPSNTVEFCIQYQTQDHTFWDNNHGNNYRLAVMDGSTESTVGMERDRGGEKKEEMEFDPFGSPRTSSGIFPEWQSWGSVETSAPYW
ncbi:protein phosphatase 1 regulatory subunit 3C-B isoform X2 [Dicentrarchus labrax]|uniref:protein phosphatase 1 regulatory subunit 3C-B isoform X2 n=1 Tax=Dicentrarchus labrax TaxID=13489 RepID=UPI0021F54D76|nr:protein phosphatase 1 regulatory subunit 3C-B isoform X2 [Dicentrarchus labrax]